MNESGYVLIALDKFKGSLTSAQANSALAEGLSEVSGIAVRQSEVSDGGDGLLELLAGTGGRLRHHEVPAGSAGEQTLRFDTVDGVPGTADGVAIESAQVVGLYQQNRLVHDPLGASSRPVGQAIQALLASTNPPRTLVIGVGGTNCTDGGLGLLRALGARALDADGREVGEGGGALGDVVAIDASRVPLSLKGVRLLFATDVDNPLYGTDGSAVVFAPQKGADQAQVDQLDRGLRRLANVLADLNPDFDPDQPGLGAGGGMPACAVALAEADIISGAQLAMAATGLASRVASARLVITGEGSFDLQTLRGKGPAQVLAAATDAGVPAIVVAGRVDPTLGEVPGARAVYTVRERAISDADSMARAETYLREIGSEIGQWLQQQHGGPTR